MTTQPITQVLLRIEKAFQEELTTDSGLKLFLDPSYSKNWYCAVTATIAELPIKYNSKDKKIIDSLKVGDEVGVSYRIVSDFAFRGDSEQFMQTTEDNPHLKEFVNAKGEWVRMYALPKRAGTDGHIWVGVHLNSRMELIDGKQGDEEEVYRWMSQFPFGKTDIYTFNNFFEYEGSDYWKCDPDDIFAKKVKGHLVAVGNRIICKPIEHDVPQEALIAQHRGHNVKIRYTDRARVLSGGKEKGIKKDDTISFDPKILERYEFFGKPYYLVNQDFVLGKWN